MSSNTMTDFFNGLRVRAGGNGRAVAEIIDDPTAPRKPEPNYAKIAADLYHLKHPIKSNFYNLRGDTQREWIDYAKQVHKYFVTSELTY